MSTFDWSKKMPLRLGRHSLLAVFCLLSACARHLDTGESLPPPPGPPPAIARPSRITVSASVPIQVLQAALDAAIPRNHHVDEHIKVLHFHIPIKGDIERGPLALFAAPPNLDFQAELRGHGSTPSNWDVHGRVAGAMLPALDSAYALHSNVHVDPVFDNAEIFHIHFAGLLTDKFRKATGNVASTVDRKLNARLNLREKAGKLWDSAFGLVRIKAPTPTYLVHTPEQVLLANPAVTRDGLVHFGMGITGNLEVVAGAEPAKPAPTLLPYAHLLPLVDGRFELDVPVIIDMQSVGQSLTQAMEDGRIRIEHGQVKLRSIDAAVQGNKLLLRLQVEVGPVWRLTDGMLFVQAEPYIDETSHSLALRGMSFSVQTQNFFSRVKAELLSPLLVDAIQAKAHLPLAPLEARAGEAANQFAQNLAGSSGGLVSVTAESVQVSGLSMVGGYLVVDVTARGVARSDLAPLLGSR